MQTTSPWSESVGPVPAKHVWLPAQSPEEAAKAVQVLQEALHQEPDTEPDPEADTV